MILAAAHCSQHSHGESQQQSINTVNYGVEHCNHAVTYSSVLLSMLILCSQMHDPLLYYKIHRSQWKNILVSFTGYKLNKNKPEVIFLPFSFFLWSPSGVAQEFQKVQNSPKFLCVFKLWYPLLLCSTGLENHNFEHLQLIYFQKRA